MAGTLFTLHFTHSLQPSLTIKEAVRCSFFTLPDRSGVEGWGRVCPLRYRLKAPTRDVWGLRAVFKVLITFTVMCSQEVRKCQHSPAKAYRLRREKDKELRQKDAAQSICQGPSQWIIYYHASASQCWEPWFHVKPPKKKKQACFNERLPATFNCAHQSQNQLH